MDARYDQAVLCGKIDKNRVRLWVDGADWQHQEVIAPLRTLTALPQKTKDGTGEVTVPLTWAIVTQLARLMEERGYGWRPDSGLNRWIDQEFIRRHTEWSPDADMAFKWKSLDWTPMPHQVAGAYVGALNERFFFCDDMRTGKTATALLTLAEMDAQGKSPWPAMVVCPASVVDPWLEELEKRFPDWPVTAYRGTKRKHLSTRYKIYVMSWDTFRADMKHEEHELPPLVNFLVPKTVVMDEAHALCCTAHATIQTPGGLKRISEVHEGDFVLGVDHSTGRDVWTRVKKVGCSPLRETVRLGTLELTPDHPVWVSDTGCVGYATSYDQDIHLRPLQELIRARESVPSAEILRPNVQVHSCEDEPCPTGSGQEGECSIAQVSGDEGLLGVGQEPIQGQGRRSYQGEGPRDRSEAWVSGTDGRERGAYYPAGAVAEAAQLGVHPRVLSEPGSAATGLPDVLQSGPWLSSSEASGGAGRKQSPLEATASPGQQKGREAGVTWLDGAEVLEYGSPEESLWNLSTDTGNYVASGILVHNCNTKTKQSTAAKQIARVADYAFLMSGTPITRDVGGFWTAMNVLDIRSFPDPDRYKDRYTDRYRGDYSDEIEGLSPATREEFHLLMQGSMRRIAKSDVNKDLPPVSYSTRVVQIPPSYRAAYDEMQADMIAHLVDKNEPLEVMSTLAQLQRLTQLASSACDVQVTMELDTKEDSPTFGEEIPRYHVTMEEPSWKIDELMNVMSENQGTDNPLIVFSPHTQLVKLAGARAEREGYRVGYVIGGQSAKKRTTIRQSYQAGEIDLLCANITAGGVGLTLNRGDTIVFIERSWAYWQNHQAEARADDVMGAKQVHVIDIVAANTVESRVRTVLKSKARQLSELVRDPRIVSELLGGQPLIVN